MELRIYGNESVTISNKQFEEVFLNVNNGCDSTRGELNISSTVNFSIHRVQIRKKSSDVKMFVFALDDDLSDVTFGYWEDAEIIFDSINGEN